MRIKADPGGFPTLRLGDVPHVTPPQMREIQRVAQETFGYDILQIIENAGRSTAQLALAMLGGKARGQRVVVLAGGGNAGASGLAATRNLVNWGVFAEPILGRSRRADVIWRLSASGTSFKTAGSRSRGAREPAR